MSSTQKQTIKLLSVSRCSFENGITELLSKMCQRTPHAWRFDSRLNRINLDSSVCFCSLGSRELQFFKLKEAMPVTSGVPPHPIVSQVKTEHDCKPWNIRKKTSEEVWNSLQNSSENIAFYFSSRFMKCFGEYPDILGIQGTTTAHLGKNSGCINPWNSWSWPMTYLKEKLWWGEPDFWKTYLV
jgi:hypothetical protein